MNTNKRYNRKNACLNITYYTPESYHKCFPEDSFEEYILNQSISTKELLENSEKNSSVHVTRVNLVAIDDEYFKWLKQNNLKNTSDSRFEYMASLDDDEIIRLWKKNDFDKLFHLDNIFFYFLSRNICNANNYSLSEKSIDVIKNSMAKHFNLQSREICTIDKLVRVDTFINEIEDKFVETFFKACNKNKIDKFHLNVVDKPIKQDKESNLCVRILPIATITENKCILSRDEVFASDNCENNILFDINDVVKEIRSTVEKDLNSNNEFAVIECMPYLVNFEDTVDVYDGFCDILGEKLKEHNLSAN